MSDTLPTILGVLSIIIFAVLVLYICIMLFVPEQKEKTLESKNETGIWYEVKFPMPKKSVEEIDELCKAGKLQFDLVVTPWGYRYLNVSIKSDDKPEVKE